MDKSKWWESGAAFAAMAILVSALTLIALALTGQAKPAWVVWPIVMVQIASAIVLAALASRTAPAADQMLFWGHINPDEGTRFAKDCFDEQRRQ